MTTKKQPESWHLSRSINIGHLVVTVGAIVGAFLYLGDIEKDISTNTNNISHNTTSIAEAKSDNHDMIKRIDSNMTSMNTKIDDLYKLLLNWKK